MQSLFDLRDQLIERFLEVWHRIQENDHFIELKDRYQSLPQHYQTLIKALGVLLVAVMIYKIPAGYMASSIEKEAAFEENRQLVRDVIAAGKLEKSIVPPTPGPSGSTLESRVQQIVTEEKVLAEQIKPTEKKDSVASPKVITKKVRQNGLKMNLTNLNLEQMVKIGEKIDQIPGVRLINWVAQASRQDSHLFSVDFELASFSVDLDTSPIEKPSTKKTSKKKKKKSRRKK